MAILLLQIKYQQKKKNNWVNKNKIKLQTSDFKIGVKSAKNSYDHLDSMWEIVKRGVENG